MTEERSKRREFLPLVFIVNYCHVVISKIFYISCDIISYMFYIYCHVVISGFFFFALLYPSYIYITPTDRFSYLY